MLRGRLACERERGRLEPRAAPPPTAAGRVNRDQKSGRMRRGAGQQGYLRVNRGGSWNDDARNVRAAYRNANHPDNRNDDLGFRLARAQEHAGGRVLDPPCHLSAGPRVRDEQQADIGVLVARAEVRASARRWSIFSRRGGGQ